MGQLKNLSSDMRSFNTPQTQHYRQLLIVLGLTSFVAPFLEAVVGSIVLPLVLLYTIILIIRGFSLPQFLVTVYTAIAVTAFVMQLVANIGSWTNPLNVTFALAAQIIFALYLGGAAYWIGRDIFTTPEATLDTVRGGISIYLLIGFVWALLYGIVETLDGHAFSQTLVFQDSYLKALHFSFTTLTTLGYGDIVPVSEIALVLTNMEAIIGQMYSTIFIAILVGSYLAKRSIGEDR